MGCVFDQKLAMLYGAWEKSPEGLLVDRLSTELIIHLLRPQRGERILDVGCGSGNHLLLFHRLGLDVTGLDASPYMLDIARSRLGNKVTLKMGRAEDLPFEDNEFDAASLIITLEFLDDPLAALKEVGRVTKHRVFVGVLNGLSPGCFGRKCFAVFRDSIFGQMQLLTLWSLRGCVKKACGNVPMEWASVSVGPSSLRRYGGRPERAPVMQSSPFGTFLGLTFELAYTLRTENLPVKQRLKRGAESPVGSSGFQV
ncbi:MAG: class I SAM-dependent methyltransferase [Deltaproteobacteria bacterium]|nr:MAG: class I SAM-dependent methyltransferase [Deltaproteobacteria bacterium]UCH06130.1 MAG: class I SAM-dependent methyltransferase [Deltaproteobacteria bacterium]